MVAGVAVTIVVVSAVVVVAVLLIVKGGVAWGATGVACNPANVGWAVTSEVCPALPPVPQAMMKSEVKRQTIYVFEIAVIKRLRTVVACRSSKVDHHRLTNTPQFAVSQRDDIEMAELGRQGWVSLFRPKNTGAF
jgi:hypothetical protein